MVLFAEPNLSLDAPVVVDEVGVEKVHAPTLFGRWETAEEQDSRVLWEKRFQWMIFYHFLFYQEFENAEKTEVILLNLRKKIAIDFSYSFNIIRTNLINAQGPLKHLKPDS